MSYEIELKAHIAQSDTERLRESLDRLEDTQFLGKTEKFDIYWSKTDDGEPIFRTRRQLDSEGPSVLFTAKPDKKKSDRGTEENRELEFTVSDRQWDSVLTFCSGVGLQVCRLKWKKGYEYMAHVNGFEIHAELLDVRYLGWFLELEICVDDLSEIDEQAADKALRKLLSLVGIDESAVEGRGYNRMLSEIGHNKG